MRIDLPRGAERTPDVLVDVFTTMHQASADALRALADQTLDRIDLLGARGV